MKKNIGYITTLFLLVPNISFSLSEDEAHLYWSMGAAESAISILISKDEICFNDDVQVEDVRVVIENYQRKNYQRYKETGKSIPAPIFISNILAEKFPCK